MAGTYPSYPMAIRTIPTLANNREVVAAGWRQAPYSQRQYKMEGNVGAWLPRGQYCWVRRP